MGYPNMMINPNLMTGYGQQSNGIQWVQGIEGAKAYQLAPNSNAQLLDSENEGIFYIKTSDNIGMCNLRVFRYEEITNAPQTKTPEVDMTQYVRKDELESFIKSYIGGTSNEQSVPTTKSSGRKSLITE